MVSSIVRGVASVLTVIVAIYVSSIWGESNVAKIAAAAVGAFVIVTMEVFVLWSPNHLSWARRLLDARAIWLGVWIQLVKSHTGENGFELQENRFAIFVVRYENGYHVDGCAYDRRGVEVAKWQSEGDPTFAKDGRRMSYVWRGIVSGAKSISGPARTGLALKYLSVGESEFGSGCVEHVSFDRRLDFELLRVSRRWLAKKNLRIDLHRMGNPEARAQFALQLTEAL